MTVSDMAKKLEITEMAVRRHLGTLERSSLIGSKLLRQSMGRPTNQYFLTEKAEDLFPKSYHSLTLDLLQDLEATEGSERIDRLFESREQRLTREYEELFSGKNLAERVATLADLQDKKGYMTSWRELEDGSFELVEYNCPIAQVAKRYNQACSCELGWFRNLMGSEGTVERTECKAQGEQNCVYRIRAKQKEH